MLRLKDFSKQYKHIILATVIGCVLTVQLYFGSKLWLLIPCILLTLLFTANKQKLIAICSILGFYVLFYLFSYKKHGWSLIIFFGYDSEDKVVRNKNIDETIGNKIENKNFENTNDSNAKQKNNQLVQSEDCLSKSTKKHQQNNFNYRYNYAKQNITEQKASDANHKTLFSDATSDIKEKEQERHEKEPYRIYHQEMPNKTSTGQLNKRNKKIQRFNKDIQQYDSPITEANNQQKIDQHSINEVQNFTNGYDDIQQSKSEFYEINAKSKVVTQNAPNQTNNYPIFFDTQQDNHVNRITCSESTVFNDNASDYATILNDDVAKKNKILKNLKNKEKTKIKNIEKTKIKNKEETKVKNKNPIIYEYIAIPPKTKTKQKQDLEDIMDILQL